LGTAQELLNFENKILHCRVRVIPGYARMEGVLDGSLICRNLKFEFKGTIWLGHLKDARITAMAPREVIPAPMLFPGFFPAVFPEKGP